MSASLKARSKMHSTLERRLCRSPREELDASPRPARYVRRAASASTLPAGTPSDADERPARALSADNLSAFLPPSVFGFLRISPRFRRRISMVGFSARIGRVLVSDGFTADVVEDTAWLVPVCLSRAALSILRIPTPQKCSRPLLRPALLRGHLAAEAPANLPLLWRACWSRICQAEARHALRSAFARRSGRSFNLPSD